MSELYRTFMLAPQPPDPHRFLDAVRQALEETGAELIGPGPGPALWLYRCPFRLGGGTPADPAGAAGAGVAAADPGTTLSLTYYRGHDVPGFSRPVAMAIDCPLQPALLGGDPQLGEANLGWLLGALEHLFLRIGGVVSCSGPDENAGEEELYGLIEPLLNGEAVHGPQLIHLGPELAARVDTAALVSAGTVVRRLPGGSLRLECGAASGSGGAPGAGREE